MKFDLLFVDKNTKARAGKIITDHGEIFTPIFMPVGTAGTVKGLLPQDIDTKIKAQIILSNTYHLYMRPGLEVLQAAGGLHQFMKWQGPILTDSGGYQVFSLAANRKLKEEGAYFYSHIDGSKHLFTPEKVMDIQRVIGADIIMAFDECTPYPCELKYAYNSMHLTHRWLDRCIIQLHITDQIYGHQQHFFPIVQGSTYPELRKQSAEYIASKNSDGNALGGLSVGEPSDEMYAMTDIVCNILPLYRPRYLMGVGTPINILESIALGVDMFDCVMPTRNARNGMLFTSQGTLNIRNKKWKDDHSVIDSHLDNNVSNYFTKSYVRHLFTCKEMLGAQIATIHNLSFYLWLVTQARKEIIDGTFYNWKNNMVKQLSQRL